MSNAALNIISNQTSGLVPLILDSDPCFLNLPEEKESFPVLARTIDQAVVAIKSQDQYSGIFINPRLDQENGRSLISLILKYRPMVPTYIISDDPTFFVEPKVLRSLTIGKIMKKPLSYSALIQELENEHHYSSDPDLAQAMKSSSEVTQLFGGSTNAYLPILARNFVSGAQSYFDLYVKLGEGKYIKILRAGESFSSDRIDSYIKKGTKSFYIPQADHERYLAHCQKILDKALNSPKLSIEVKSKMTGKMGDEVLNFMEKVGLSENTIKYAKDFTEHSLKLVSQMKLNRNETIAKFLNDISNTEHGVGVSMLASLMSHNMGFSSTKAVHLIGLSSLLHDIGLQGESSESLRNENELEMSKEELEIYYNHPEIGRDILANIPVLDSIVPQVAFQHHERRDREGFPKKTKLGNLSPVAEIVGVCDEFLRRIHRSQSDTKVDPFKDMQHYIYNSFSLPVVEAFNKAFNRFI